MQTGELSCQARRSPPTSSLPSKQAPCPPATRQHPPKGPRGWSRHTACISSTWGGLPVQLWRRSVAVGVGSRCMSRPQIRSAPIQPCPRAAQIRPNQGPREETRAHSMHLEHLRRPWSAPVEVEAGCGSRYDVYLQGAGGARRDDDLRRKARRTKGEDLGRYRWNGGLWGAVEKGHVSVLTCGVRGVGLCVCVVSCGCRF